MTGPMITLTATFDDNKRPQGFAAYGPERATEAEALADLDFFPKSAKFTMDRVTFVREGRHGFYYQIQTQANLAADGVNKGVNETGVKRYRTVVRNAECMGIVWQGSEVVYPNSYLSREEFEAALVA